MNTDSGEVSTGKIREPSRERLKAWLAGLPTEDAELVMEGCTGWHYVAQELEAAGMRARIADPAEAAALKGNKKRAKTDRADAKHLRMLLTLPEGLAPAHA